MTFLGECFCGEVSYEIEGQLTDARFCHCSRCRKIQASPYAVVDGTFRWVTGEKHLKANVNEAGIGYQFCGSCGSALCGTFQGNVHGVMLACLVDDPGVELQRHIYVGSKAPWETIPTSGLLYDEDVTD